MPSNVRGAHELLFKISIAVAWLLVLAGAGTCLLGASNACISRHVLIYKWYGHSNTAKISIHFSVDYLPPEYSRISWLAGVGFASLGSYSPWYIVISSSFMLVLGSLAFAIGCSVMLGLRKGGKTRRPDFD
jgi:hypothetical protein